MWRAIGRWPFVLGAVVCLALGVWLISLVPNGNLGAGTVLLTLGALLLGVQIGQYVRTPDESGPLSSGREVPDQELPPD